MSVDPKRVQAVFLESIEQSSAAARAAVLERECGDDAELRRRVEALLQAHDQPGSSLEQPVADAGATSDELPGQWLNPDELPETPLEGVGSRIKQYKLLQQIGEGGMGVVFMAEQQEPVRRMVALKVIKAGMDSAQVIARFEQERQALALMDHPNIAKVLDAGTTASGRPFFVMELVKGIPMTKYCDEQRLTPKQRLELFVPVCQAIQHAHQKGIIHRDIKPSNVLIAAYDGKPVPKVIDFGVAKAAGQKLTERTLFTGFGGLVGTLEYMSPEQAEFNALDIDTRSDVYSLGVLLYELLTGTTPLSRRRIKDAAIMEVLRLIREEEPQKPSTRLSDSKDSLASLSAQRQMEPAALVKSLRNEVDWIVMKALEKDRTRRYETANGLARDIGRYLAEEPVEAGPPSARYRLRKLAWKHRRGLATAAALLLLLVAGAVLSTILAAWAMRAEAKVREQLTVVQEQKERAEKAETEAKDNEAKARQEEARAKKAEENAKAVLDYFQDNVLSAGRPKDQDGGLGRDVKLREAVDKAAEKIAESFKDRPMVEASIRHTLGITYGYLGDYAQAIRHHERGLALHAARLGTDHRDTLISRKSLADACLEAGRIPEAIRLLEQTLKQFESTLGPDHLSTNKCRTSLAIALWSAGHRSKAIPFFEQAVKQNEAQLGPDHPETLATRNNLAEMYRAAGRFSEAIRLLEPTLKQQEAKLAHDHPSVLTTRNNLAGAYFSAGRTAEAIPLFEQTLKQREGQLGTDHPRTFASRNNLAAAYWFAGRTAEAIRLHEQNLKQSEAKLGPDHPDTLTSRNNLATAYASAGRTTEAIRLFEPTLKQLVAKLGQDHPGALTARNNLANAYRDDGRVEEAIRLHEQNLNLCQAKVGPSNPLTLFCRIGLAKAYQSAGRNAEAVRLCEPALKLLKEKLGPEHPKVADALAVLGRCLLQEKKYAEAEPLLRDSLKIAEAKQPGNWKTFDTQSLLGAALLGQKKYADAEPLLLKAYQGQKEREAKIPSFFRQLRLREALERLVQLYDATGKKDKAAKWREKLKNQRK